MRIYHLLVATGLALTAASASAGPSVRLLDFATLSDCAKRSLATQRRTGTHDETVSQFAAARAAMALRAAAIEAERASVDRRSPVQVALFNERAARACAEYAALVVAYNEAISPGNVEAVAFNTDCADRDFDPTMVARLPAGLRTAWRTATGGGEDTAMLSPRAMR